MGSIAAQIGLLTLVGTCLFAWAKGGSGERAGAAAVAVAWIGSLAVQALLPRGIHAIPLLLFDVALAAALLIIAIRYSSLWLGAAMLLQGFVLAVHAEALSDSDTRNMTYVVVLNLASYVMLLAIIASTAGAWIKRNKARAAATASAPPPPGVATAA